MSQCEIALRLMLALKQIIYFARTVHLVLSTEDHTIAENRGR